MSDLVRNTTVVSQGLARFLEQYKGKPVFQNLMSIYLGAVQELEDTTWNTIYAFMLDSAVGNQLDILGRIVGRPRQGRDDDNYRIWIKVQIRINRSKGKPDDIIECIKLATDADFELREYGDAAFAVIFATEPDFPNDVAAISYLARAAGVHVDVIYPTGDHVFRFKNEGDPDDPTSGFSDGS